MPETDVKVNLGVEDSDFKRKLREDEEALREFQRTTGLHAPFTGQPTMGPLMQQAMAQVEANRQIASSAKEAGQEIGQLSTVAEGASESFGRMGGMLERIAVRLAIFELLREAIKAVGAAIKEALDVQEAEARFQNMVDTTEHGVEVFQQLRSAANDYNIDFRKEAEPTIRMLIAQGVAEEDLQKRFIDLAGISKVYGADLKTIASQFEQIQETGTVSLQQLIKLSNELGGAFREQVSTLKEAEDEYKRINTETANAEKAFRQQSQAADKATESQTRLAEKLGLTKAGPEQAPPSTFAEIYHREFLAGQAGKTNLPDTSAITEALGKQVQSGISKVMQETGWSRQQIEALHKSGQLDTQFFLSEGREATRDAEKAQEGVFEHVREFEKDRYARQRTEIAQQITPEAVTGRPGFQDQLNKVMGTLNEQLGKLSDPLGKIVTNTAEMAKDTTQLTAMLAGGT